MLKYRVNGQSKTVEVLTRNRPALCAEILTGEEEVALDNPFSDSAEYLISCHDAKENQYGGFVEPLCCIACDNGEQNGFKEDSRKPRDSGHSEQEGVCHGRRHGGEKACAPAVDVGTDKGKEIDGQPCHPALRNEVEELGHYDIAGNENNGGQICFRTAER